MKAEGSKLGTPAGGGSWSRAARAAFGLFPRGPKPAFSGARSAHLAWPAAAQFFGPFLGGCCASIGGRNTGECVRILGHLKPGLQRQQKTRQHCHHKARICGFVELDYFAAILQTRPHFVDSVLIGHEVVKLLCPCSNNTPIASLTLTLR